MHINFFHKWADWSVNERTQWDQKREERRKKVGSGQTQNKPETSFLFYIKKLHQMKETQTELGWKSK